MLSDHDKYQHFAGRAKIEKAINSLLGTIEGILIDGDINEAEAEYMLEWIRNNEQYRHLHPFNELIPVVLEALEDGVITEDERYDILWLCGKLKSEEYFKSATADIQRLHALIGGILADGKVTEDEIACLSLWIEKHDHLSRCWPYDEVNSIIASVMADGKIDPEEQGLLKGFFCEIIEPWKNEAAVEISLPSERIQGVCAVCPDIVFQESWFCFTGSSMRNSREELSAMVLGLGGKVSKSIVKNLDYLVIGAESNPCWAYSCYGRKVEKAIEYRKKGYKILMVHENDFHDAINDL